MTLAVLAISTGDKGCQSESSQCVTNRKIMRPVWTACFSSTRSVTMADFGRFKVHPLAEEFPLLEGEEFNNLVADIARNGLLEPIVLLADNETLVDGRNRYRAADQARVDPRFTTLPRSY